MRLIFAILLQTSWIFALLFLATKAKPGSATLWILLILTLCYLPATILLMLKKRQGWLISLVLALASTFISTLWILAHLAAYWGGIPTYKDSPASAIVAMIIGGIVLVPSATQSLLLWTLRTHPFQIRNGS